MNRFPSSLALAALVAASLAAGAGCSILGDEADVTVQASDAALTDKGSDKLFTLTLSDAPKAYDAEKILVRASADGVADKTLVITFGDKNGDGKLDKDETIDCVEPAENAFGPSIVGKEVKVVVLYTGDGSEKEIANATWTPAK